jgi:photosystem II stability/assembly factor-like uncharacterized protein
MAAQRLLLGTRKGLLQFERNGQGWKLVRESFPGAPVPYALHDRRTDTLWASLDYGHWGSKLHRSRDGGETWEEIAAPVYPEGSEARPGVPASLRYIWTIAAGGDDQPERLYLGTEPGGLFRSDDGGDTFAIVDPLWNHPSRLQHWMGGGRDEAGIHSVLVDPRDSKHVMIAVSCAGVFETTDDGANWEVRSNGMRAEFLPDPDTAYGQDPHLIVMAPTNPDVLWQQNHCGIYRTVDGAASWQHISRPGETADFGFAIAASPKSHDTAWVVPAQSDEVRAAVGRGLVVCRTENGGTTWDTLTRGLPSEGCFDLVYRHGLDISGETLAFASTTGNFYISSDGGEAWECLSNNLPPVYSVRFAD